MDSSPRPRVRRRGESCVWSVLDREVQLCCERTPRGPSLIHGALGRVPGTEPKSEEFFGGPPGKPEILHHPHLKPPETAVSQKCFTFSDPESVRPPNLARAVLR